MEVQLACVVEGHGDREAVPILVRRIAESLDPPALGRVLPPIRIPRGKLLKPGELERAVDLAGRQVVGGGATLIVLDSDDDCPATLGPELLKRAQDARHDVPVAVVLAKREFEAWFLAGAESLRGQRGLPNDLTAPVDPETVRGAKEWLSCHMQGGRTYTATLDQPALAEALDLALARRADSFDKCYRDITRLLTALRSTLPPSTSPSGIAPS